jgi:hypothetical protein
MTLTTGTRLGCRGNARRRRESRARARSVESEARPGCGRARGVLFLRPNELFQEPRVLLEGNRAGAIPLEGFGLLGSRPRKTVEVERLRAGS